MCRWYLIIASVTIVFIACSCRREASTSEELLDGQRDGDPLFTSVDYAVMRAAIEDTLKMASSPNVVVEPQTLSMAKSGVCGHRDVEAHVLDRLNVSMLQFCQIASSYRLESSFTDSFTEVTSGARNGEDKANAVYVTISEPVYARSGRAFILLHDTNKRGNSGTHFLCLSNGGDEWIVEKSLLLGIE